MKAVRDLSQKFPLTYAKLIEDKANGSAVIQMLQHEIPGMLPVNPSGGKVARAFGILDDKENVALRASFILDAKRTIVYAVVSPTNVGRSVSETLRVVRALRSGKLCPADWEPGSDFGPTDAKY